MVDFLGDLKQELADLKRRIRDLESASPVGYTSVSEGALEIRSAEGLIVDGSARVIGLLYGDGTLTWVGPWSLQGDGQISGDATITGDLILTSGRVLAGAVTITPTSGGRIQVSSLQIDGANGGTLRSSSTIYVEAPLRVVGQMAASSVLAFGSITGESLSISGAKSFRMPHPTKPDHWLRHGSTESPVSGIEYWGDETLDASGECTVELPDYFEDLAKPDGRTVFVTGRGFAADWADIDAGTFTVTGQPGGRFSWLVKAERFGGDFLVEEPTPVPVDQDLPLSD